MTRELGLVISRKIGSKIRIGKNVLLTVLGIGEWDGVEVVRLGIAAPREIEVHRKEVWLRIQQDKEAEKQK